MKILTNSRHWKQNAWAVVRIENRGDFIRANLVAITKTWDAAMVIAGKTGWLVLVTTENGTPEKLCHEAAQRYLDEKSQTC